MNHPQPCKIRPAKVSELDYLGYIEKTAAQLYPPQRIPQPPQSLPLRVLKKALKEQLLFVAEIENQLAGFASCHSYQTFLHLDEISVLPEWGRKGIGKALMTAVIEAGRQRKLHACTLTTFEDLEWNAPFYQGLGFEILSGSKIPHSVELILWEEKNIGLIHRVAMIKIIN